MGEYNTTRRIFIHLSRRIDRTTMDIHSYHIFGYLPCIVRPFIKSSISPKLYWKNLFQTIIKIHEALEDKSVSPEEAQELIKAAILILQQIRPIVKSWFGKIAIDGAISILKDTAQELHSKHA